MESIVPENPSLKGLKPGTKLTNKINGELDLEQKINVRHNTIYI